MASSTCCWVSGGRLRGEEVEQEDRGQGQGGAEADGCEPGQAGACVGRGRLRARTTVGGWRRRGPWRCRCPGHRQGLAEERRSNAPTARRPSRPLGPDVVQCATSLPPPADQPAIETWTKSGGVGVPTDPARGPAADVCEHDRQDVTDHSSIPETLARLVYCCSEDRGVVDPGTAGRFRRNESWVTKDSAPMVRLGRIGGPGLPPFSSGTRSRRRRAAVAWVRQRRRRRSAR